MVDIDPATAEKVWDLLDSIDVEGLRRQIDKMQKLLAILERRQSPQVPLATASPEVPPSRKPHGYWFALIDAQLSSGPKTVGEIAMASGPKTAHEKALAKTVVRQSMKAHPEKYAVSPESNGVMKFMLVKE